MAIERLGDFQRAQIFNIQRSQLRTQAAQAQPTKPTSDEHDDDAVVFNKSSSNGSSQLTPNYTRPRTKASAQSTQTDAFQSSDSSSAILNATIAGGTVVQNPAEPVQQEEAPEIHDLTTAPKEPASPSEPEGNATPAVNEDTQGESANLTSNSDIGAELNVTA